MKHILSGVPAFYNKPFHPRIKVLGRTWRQFHSGDSDDATEDGLQRVYLTKRPPVEVTHSGEMATAPLTQHAAGELFWGRLSAKQWWADWSSHWPPNVSIGIRPIPRGDGIDTDLRGRIAKSSPSVFRERCDVLQLRLERSFFFAELTCFWNNKKSYGSIIWVEICTKVTQKLTNSRLKNLEKNTFFTHTGIFCQIWSEL